MAEVHIWDADYKSVAPSARTLKDWIGQGPIGLILTGSTENEDGTTKSVAVKVIEQDGSAHDVTVTVVRIMRQLANLAKVGTDRTIAEVAAYGQRGYVLAPPAGKVAAAFKDAVASA